MYVQLAVAWTDPAGVVHNAGEIVDIDAVTLAELEERGVVEDVKASAGNIGPGPGEPADKPNKPPIGPGPGVPDPGEGKPGGSGTDGSANN